MLANEQLDRETLLATLARLDHELLERKCRRNLTAWCVEALEAMEQVPARHHRLLLDYLNRVASGEIDRLLISMPPGHGKSTYTSALFPPWFFAQGRNRDMIGASHGSELAEDFSRIVQGHVRTHPRLLGYSLTTENVKRWITTNGGRYRAAGAGGSITGRRSDLTLIDDPFKGHADAESETMREAIWNWYVSEVYTRQKPGSRIVVIATRWNEDDLTGRLLQAAETGGDKWVYLRLPAICDSLNDPLGRAIGEALWPEWQDETALERIRVNVGPYVWGALYQQDPKPRGASFFNLDNLLVPNAGGILGPNGEPVCGPVEMPDRCDTVFALVDTAIKTGKEHNSTGITYFSYNTLTQPTTLILDWDLIQIEGAKQEGWLQEVFVRLEELALQCGARRGSSGAIIEDKATGSVLLQQAENARREGKHYPAHPIDSILTAMGKEERAIAASPYVVSGDIKLTQPAYDKMVTNKGRSANHLILQITSFRLGSKVTDGLDLLDTFCYGVLMTHGTAAGERKGV